MIGQSKTVPEIEVLNAEFGVFNLDFAVRFGHFIWVILVGRCIRLGLCHTTVRSRLTMNRAR